ncbi:MAG: hypothetical protein HY817_04865 [Candidatus Abawacabacteria bacterium]|nr:hypothetical protein [Candidatus Abawacabacteria bacterium]
MDRMHRSAETISPSLRSLLLPAIMAAVGACNPDVNQPNCVEFDANTVRGTTNAIEVVVTTDQPGTATVVKLTPLRRVSGGFQELARPSTTTITSDGNGRAIHRITIASVTSAVTDIAVNACVSAQGGRYQHDCPEWILLRVQ